MIRQHGRGNLHSCSCVSSFSGCSTTSLTILIWKIRYLCTADQLTGKLKDDQP